MAVVTLIHWVETYRAIIAYAAFRLHHGTGSTFNVASGWPIMKPLGSCDIMMIDHRIVQVARLRHFSKTDDGRTSASSHLHIFTPFRSIPIPSPHRGRIHVE